MEDFERPGFVGIELLGRPAVHPLFLTELNDPRRVKDLKVMQEELSQCGRWAR